MERMQKIAETSGIMTYKNNTCETVDDILTTLSLQQHSSVILINGRRALTNQSVLAGAEIIILPRLPGLF
jgi:hypothetical protein